MFKRLFFQFQSSLFLVLFIVGFAVAIYSLRHNNQTMVGLRQEVYAADEAGGDVNGALNKLREYVYGHMNTNLSSGGNTIKPPIQLKYTYERLLEIEQQKAVSENNKLYTEAQTYCQQQIPAGTSGRGRVPCVQEYVASRGLQTTPIPVSLYQFDFVSPSWSPDLAGWSLVFTGLMLAAFIFSWLLQLMTRRKIKEPT